MIKLNKKYFLVGLILILGINYKTFIQSDSTSTEKTSNLTNIVVSTGSIKKSIEVSGEAQIVDEQSLSFNKEGTINKVYFKEGDTIKKGDIIAELDSSDAYDSIEEGKINLENARINLLQLYEKVDESQILQAKNSITTAENNLDISKKELENLIKTQENGLTELQDNLDISKKELENLKNNLNIALSELDILKKEKENSLGNTLSNKSTTIQNIEISFASNLSEIEKIIEQSDYIMGVTNENEDKNDSYEDFLGAENKVIKNEANKSLLEAIGLYNTLKSSLITYEYTGDKEEIIGLLEKFLSTYEKLASTTDLIYKTLEDSIVSEGSLSESDIDSKKSTMSSYRSSSQSKANSINSAINTLRTLTDTDLVSMSDKNSIASKEESINSTKLSIEKKELEISNSLKDLETTKNSYNITLKSKENDVRSKEISLEIADLNLKELLEGPTEENVAKANNSIKQAELKLESAYKNLDDYKLEAPFDGIVRKIDYMVGDNITNDTDKYVYIENPNLLEITVMLDQIDITKVKLGQKASITFDAYSDIKVKAIISSIDTKPVQSSGVVSYEVKLVLNDESFDKKVLSGMTTNVEIITESKENILIVQTTAIIEKDGKKYVNLIRNGQKVETEVVTGISSDGMIEIASGLRSGDILVIEEFSTSSSNKGSTSLFSPSTLRGSSTNRNTTNSTSNSNRNFGPQGGF